MRRMPVVLGQSAAAVHGSRPQVAAVHGSRPQVLGFRPLQVQRHGYLQLARPLLWRAMLAHRMQALLLGWRRAAPCGCKSLRASGLCPAVLHRHPLRVCRQAACHLAGLAVHMGQSLAGATFLRRRGHTGLRVGHLAPRRCHRRTRTKHAAEADPATDGGGDLEPIAQVE